MRELRDGLSKILKVSKISSKRACAFSLTEVLISMLIIAVLGGVAVTALGLFFGSFSQMDDYTTAEAELNYAVQRLSREFAMIGLGMPNNRDGEGSFALSFRGFAAAGQPIIAHFGESPPGAWGGPVTVAANSTNSGPAIAAMIAGRGFVGPELFYAWAVPTEVMALITGLGTDVRAATNNTPLHLELIPTETRTTPGVRSGADILGNVRWDGRNVGLQAMNATGGGSGNIRTWLLLPTLRLPLLAESIEMSGLDSSLNVRIAPLQAGSNAWAAERTVMKLDEVHLMQAARIYRHAGTRELRRVILNAPFPEEVLARNVVGLQLVFDPASRVLTMYAAARGYERSPAGARGRLAAWPSWLPEQISDEDSRYRIVVKTLTWRIRN